MCVRDAREALVVGVWWRFVVEHITINRTQYPHHHSQRIDSSFSTRASLYILWSTVGSIPAKYRDITLRSPAWSLYCKNIRETEYHLIIYYHALVGPATATREVSRGSRIAYSEAGWGGIIGQALRYSAYCFYML